MQPWIIDAKDLTELPAIDNFDRGLLASSPAIQSFLSSTSSDTNIVAGPKGFGKTLLLKIKRQEINERKGFTFTPQDQLVDKPVGVPTILSQKELSDQLESTQYWKQVWQISICISVLKQDNINISEFNSSKIQRIYSDKKLKSPCDIFDLILSLSRKEFIKAISDWRENIVPNLRLITSQHAIFIDNVDEYFESAASYSQDEKLLANGNLKLWVFSQCGLVTAAREINGLNNHIKCWVSIRSEALEHLFDVDPMAAQIGGSTVLLGYNKKDLKNIFEKNIDAEKSERLVNTVGDHYYRFFGKNCTEIENLYVPETEDIFNYLLRHTLWRPRDLAIIGKSISEIPPNRRTEEHISQTINERATFIARSYLAESKIHTQDFFPDILFGLINSNTLSRDEISHISKTYDTILNEANREDKERHSMCTLYRLGLLGTVQMLGGNREARQNFPEPGKIGFLSKNVLPDSEFYLIHPILINLISERNGKFLENINPLNIVGNSRKWYKNSDIHYIFKGDVVGYSRIMDDPDLASTFPNKFQEISNRARKNNNVNLEISGGDSIILYGQSPEKLIRAVQDIKYEMKSSIFEVDFRFAGDAGLIKFIENEDGIKISGGKCVRVAARLEPKVPSGSVVVTDRFQQFFLSRDKKNQNNISMIELIPQNCPEIECIEGVFNLAKSEAEQAILHKLFKVELI